MLAFGSAQTDILVREVRVDHYAGKESSYLATVLLVEDDVDTRDAIKETLEDAGYRVAHARNGADALMLLRDTPAPSLILLDLFMPVMNGWDFLQSAQMSREFHDIPVVVITATPPHWGHPPHRVLPKPVTRAQLLLTVGEALAAPCPDATTTGPALQQTVVNIPELSPRGPIGPALHESVVDIPELPPLAPIGGT
jgi:CheY-like chemotaxis protein